MLDAVEENFVGVRVASADKQRGLRAQLAGLHHNRSRHQAQSASQVVAQRQIERPENAGGLAGLRLGRGGSGGRDHDGLAHPLRLEHNVALDRIEPAGVKAGRLQLAKALGGNQQEEAAFDPGNNLKTAVSRGDSGADCFAAADQNHVGAGDLGARGVRDHAADGGCRAESGAGGEQKQSECAGQHRATGIQRKKDGVGNRHDGSFVPLGTQVG